MLTQTPPNPRQKLWFVITFPLLALLLVSCSLLKIDAETKPEETTSSLANGNPRIGKITWVGNTLYSEEALNRALKLREGDVYKEGDFNQHLFNSPKTGDVASLYMNRGYHSFDIQVKETPTTNNRVDLEMHVYEGKPIKIGQVLIQGDTQVSREDILRMINISPGELYNRSKFMQSRWNLTESDLFGNLYIRQIPNPAQGTIDLEYNLHKSHAGTLFLREKEVGAILINGQPFSSNRIRIGTKGLLSIRVIDAPVNTLPENDLPAQLTIEVRSQDNKTTVFTRKWTDYRQLGSFDISEALSHSRPGDCLLFFLVNEELASGTAFPVFIRE